MAMHEFAELGADFEVRAAESAFEPQIVTDPGHIRAHLQQLLQMREPVLIHFPDGAERFRSALISVRREYDLIALDEVVPFSGSALIRAGVPLDITGYHDGVRMRWHCAEGATPGLLEGLPCYWMAIPTQMAYFQRRQDFRVRVVLADLPDAQLMLAEISSTPILARLIDISSAGCRLIWSGDYRQAVAAGARYPLSLQIPNKAAITINGEIRHLQYNEERDLTMAGIRFSSLGTTEQRTLQQWVFQLQREAHRARSNMVL